MTDPQRRLSPGDEFHFTFDSEPGRIHSARIIDFKSDAAEGLGPEVEDYVACWIDIEGGEGEPRDQGRAVMLGTDGKYRLDGRPINIVDRTPEAI